MSAGSRSRRAGRIRDEGLVAPDVLRNVMLVLDLEESMAERATTEASAERETEPVTPPTVTRAGCGHLQGLAGAPSPTTPDGCEECLRDGTTWVHLRLCLTCGHVGCCDSSPHRHAWAHHRDSEHPVIQSFEVGEAWRWCFVDELLG